MLALLDAHEARDARRLALLLLFQFLPGALAAQLAPIGLSEVGAQWFENQPIGMNPIANAEEFGAALAAGDFNGDGADDLATGIPNDKGLNHGCNLCGAVVVRFGTKASGLSAAPATVILSQEAQGSGDPAAVGERFGWALATGDFDFDGRDDLAVGILYNTTGASGAGAVAIHYGLPTAEGGIQLVGEQLLRQGADDLPGTAAINDGFGSTLVAARFDPDSYVDLAIGATGDSESGSANSGSVLVLHGSSTGLVPATGALFHQGLESLNDVAESNDGYGAALAAGDFDGDGFTDLAIGVPGEDASDGAVQIVFGGANGLDVERNTIWRMGDALGASEPGARFGSALAVGDFDADGHDDLAIGCPADALGTPETTPSVGSIGVAYGADGGFDLLASERYTQGSVYENAAYDQTFDEFGAALAAGDFDGDGADDLAVGHPGETGSAQVDGAVTILMGAATSGLVSRFRFVSSGLVGLPDGPQQSAGRPLAVGDFDGTGFADLAVGVPLRDLSGATNGGAEFVLYGALFADGFEVGSPYRWSSVVQ